MIQCLDVIKTENKTKAKVKRLKFDSVTNDVITPYLRKRRERVTLNYFRKVIPNLAIAYEEYATGRKKKKEFGVWQSVIKRRELEERKEQELKPKVNIMDYVTKILENPEGFETMRYNKNTITASMIKAKFNVTYEQSKEIRALVEQELRKKREVISLPLPDSQ